MSKPSEIVHYSFVTGILIKGFGALAEIVTGIALFFITPSKLLSFVVYITAGELNEDPTDRIAHFLLQTAQAFSVDARTFGIVYLLTQGLVKLIVVMALFREKLWAFPFGIFVSAASIAYLLYRFSYTHSPWLIALSLVDIIIIIFIILEYRQRKTYVQALPATKIF